MKKTLFILLFPLLAVSCGGRIAETKQLLSEDYASGHPDWIVQDNLFSDTLTFNLNEKRAIDFEVRWTVALDTTALGSFDPVYRIASIEIDQLAAPRNTRIDEVKVLMSAADGADEEGRRFEYANIFMSGKSGSSTFHNNLAIINGLGGSQKSLDFTDFDSGQ